MCHMNQSTPKVCIEFNGMFARLLDSSKVFADTSFVEINLRNSIKQ